MATAKIILDAAYVKCGIRSPDTIDYDEGLLTLNNMLGSWSVDVVIPVFIQEEHDLIVGKSIYSVGSGGDFDTVRPINISNAYLKDSDGYSYPLKILSSQDYGRIGQKNLEGRPGSFFYYPTYPLGEIIFNKEADRIYTMCFESVQHLTEFASIDTEVVLPDEYKEALVYNSAVRLAENVSVDLPVSVITLAQTTYTVLAKITAINQMPPIARFDFGTGAPSNIVTGE